MTKEHLALIALALTLIGTVFSGGIQLGTLTERVETQTKQIELLNEELRAIHDHFVLWTQSHRDGR